MKNILILSFVTLVLASCGADKKMSVEDIIATNNLEQIRQKKSQLDTEQQALVTQLKQLEVKIKELDPQRKIPLITTFKAKETIFNHFLELQGNVSTKQNSSSYIQSTQEY